MNSTPTTFAPAALWQSNAEIAELYPVGSAPAARRRTRPWQQRLGVLAIVVAMQVGLVVAIVKAGVVTLPPLTQAIEVFAIPAQTVAVPAPLPPVPTMHTPSDTVVVPVQFDIASDTAITIAPAQPHPAAAPSVSGSNSAAKITSYQLALLQHLAMYKRYPASARFAHREGVVNVRFTMARDGRVLDAALASSSHNAALDEEGVALLHRASPLPAPPPEIPGDTIAMVVPVDFSLR